MIQKLIGIIVITLLTQVKPEDVKGYVDRGLDWLEDGIKKSGTKFDDATVLPIIDKIREIFDIPDNDAG